MNLKLFILILPVLLLMLSTIPVQAQTHFYYNPGLIQFWGDVPGFELRAVFSYSSASGIVCGHTRANNFTVEVGRKTQCVSLYDGIDFITDTINTYTVKVHAEYPEPVNQTIIIYVTSAGKQTAQNPIWVIADIIDMTFEITTQLSPTSPEAYAQAVAQLNAAKDKAQQTWQTGVDQQFGNMDQSLYNLYGLIAATFLCAFFAVAKLQRRFG